MLAQDKVAVAIGAGLLAVAAVTVTGVVAFGDTAQESAATVGTATSVTAPQHVPPVPKPRLRPHAVAANGVEMWIGGGYDYPPGHHSQRIRLPFAVTGEEDSVIPASVTLQGEELALP